MLASTRGPSRKPVWAATNRIAPSENMVTRKNAVPSGTPPSSQRCTNEATREALSVLPGCPST